MKKILFGLLALILAASSAQAEYADGKVNIVFTDANYSEKSCVLSFDARNNTKYHVNKISFVIGTWQHRDFRISELPANAYADKNQVEVNLSENENCSDQVAFIIHNIGKASALVCLMPNIIEGDCQQMVAISTSLNDNLVRKIQAVEDVEKAKAAAAKAALVAACSKLRPAVDTMERCTARCNGDAGCNYKCGLDYGTPSYNEWYGKCESQGIAEEVKKVVEEEKKQAAKAEKGAHKVECSKVLAAEEAAHQCAAVCSQTYPADPYRHEQCVIGCHSHVVDPSFYSDHPNTSFAEFRDKCRKGN
jgi:hypothetical protein